MCYFSEENWNFSYQLSFCKVQLQLCLRWKSFKGFKSEIQII